MSNDREAELPIIPDEQELPPALAAAVERARARQPKPDQVAALMARVSELGPPAGVVVPHRSLKMRWAACVAVVAATVLLAVTVSRQFRPPPKLQGPEMVVVPSPPVTPKDVGTGQSVVSEVTRIPLVAASFGQIEEDIKEAESQVTLAAEAIAMAEVRRDLRRTLDEYPRWGR